MTELEFPSEEPRLAIEALLLDGVPIRIRIGRTNSLGEDRITFRVREVSAVLYQDDTLWRELMLLSESEESVGPEPRLAGLFGTEEFIELRRGSRYRLEVTAPGFPDLISTVETYRGRYYTDRIDILKTEDTLSDGRCFITNYQIVIAGCSDLDEYYVIDEFFESEPRRRLLEGELFNNAVFGFDDLAEGDTLYLSVGDNRTISCVADEDFPEFSAELYVVDQSWKDFVNAVALSYNEIAGLFSNPPPIPHNVTGGYGYFGLGTAYTFPITE